MVRQVGILYCRAVGPGSNLVVLLLLFFLLLFCYGSDGIYAVDPFT